MTQVLYIFFGWLLGLFSPLIVDYFNSKKQAKEFMASTRIELRDLQYRLAISSFLLEQLHGQLTVDFVRWIKPIVDNYEGHEPNENIKAYLEKIINDPQEKLDERMKVTRAKEGAGSNLKIFRPSYVFSNLQEISKLPTALQRRFHEFLNQLNHLNQEIQSVQAKHTMTFDASMTERNHEILTNEIISSYVQIARASRRVADKIEAIVA